MLLPQPGCKQSSSCCQLGTFTHAGFCASIISELGAIISCLFSSKLTEDSLKLEEVHQEFLKHALLHDISSVESILLLTQPCKRLFSRVLMQADLDSSSAAKTAPTMKQKMSEEIILFISAGYQRGFYQQGVLSCTVAICNNHHTLYQVSVVILINASHFVMPCERFVIILSHFVTCTPFAICNKPCRTL